MDKIFEPKTIGPLSIPNRIVMAPMTRARADKDGSPNQMMAEYYMLRASAGLIITEATNISPQAIGWERSPGIFTKKQIAGWKKVTTAAHRNGGRIILQLWHTGRASHSYFQENGKRPVSSYAKAKNSDDPVMTDEGEKDPEIPHQLDINEIASIIGDYRIAAENAVAAGFDGVEIHAANGYLIDQFLRDGVNERDDDYGGSIDNRSRFLIEVLEAVLTVWDSKRVGIRLSPANPFNSMSDSDPEKLFTTISEKLNSYNLAYLHLLEARPNLNHQMSQDNVPYVAPKIREIYTGNLILNAGYDYVSGNEAIESGEADFIAFGVPYIANPDLVERFALSAPLNDPDQRKFYTHEAEGYIDYPLLEVEKSMV